MKVKSNLGKIDRFMRIGAGFAAFGYGIVRESDVLMIYGSKKIAEGITGFCVLYHLLGITTENNKIESTNNKNKYYNLNLK